MLRFGSRSVPSDAFARWFGRSAVTNPDGSPRVVYHHTHSEPFEVFDRFFAGRKGIDQAGSWFTSIGDTPLYGKHIRPFYLSIQKPLVYRGADGWWELHGDIGDRSKTTEAKV